MENSKNGTWSFLYEGAEVTYGGYFEAKPEESVFFASFCVHCDLYEKFKKTKIEHMNGIFEGNRNLTLIDCHFYDAHSEHSRENIRVYFISRLAIEYGHFPLGAPVTFNEILLEVPQLSDWLTPSEININVNKEADHVDYIKIKRMSPLCYSIDAETILEFGSCDTGLLFVRQHDHHIHYNEIPYIKISSTELKSFEYFENILHSILSLISITSCRRPKISKVFAKSSLSISEHLDEGTAVLDLFSSSFPTEEVVPEKRQRKPVFFRKSCDSAIFILADDSSFRSNKQEIELEFKTMISSWIEKFSDMQHIIDRFLNFRNYEDLHVVTVFLDFVQALEAYHRKLSLNGRVWDISKSELKKIKENALATLPEGYRQRFKDKLDHVNEVDLHDRLEELTLPLGKSDPYVFFGGNKDREDFIFLVKKTRNYFTHYDKNNYVMTYSMMSQACNVLKTILEFHIYAGLGCDKNNLRQRAIRSREYQRDFAVFSNFKEQLRIEQCESGAKDGGKSKKSVGKPAKDMNK